MVPLQKSFISGRNGSRPNCSGEVAGGLTDEESAQCCPLVTNNGVFVSVLPIPGREASKAPGCGPVQTRILLGQDTYTIGTGTNGGVGATCWSNGHVYHRHIISS
jgi:hypothetical protein